MSNVSFLQEFKGGSMAQTFLAQKDGLHFIRKLSDLGHNSGDKLYKQWLWLYEFGKEHPGIFPEVSLFVIERDKCHYDMQYLEMGTLRDLLLKDDVDLYLFEDVLEIGAEIAVPVKHKENGKTYVENKHLKKMLERNKVLEPYPFYKSEYISINGKKYKNLKTLIEEIRNNDEFIDFVAPKKWYRSHGDFTFQNILTDGEIISVIDPRGEGPDSIYYDVSKILQSAYAKYDLLYEGNYKADFKGNSINYEIFENVELFDRIYKTLVELIPDYYDLEDDWLLIAKFYCASHMISMAPFRLKENIEITLICYAIGVLILNEVINEWRIKKNSMSMNGL